MAKRRRDKLAQCRHEDVEVFDGQRWVWEFPLRDSVTKLGVRCQDCQQLLSLGEASEPEVDVAAGALIQDWEETGEVQRDEAVGRGYAGLPARPGQGIGWDAGWLFDAYVRHDELQQLAELEAPDDWKCPVQSSVCAVRRKCTNKCGALDRLRAELEDVPGELTDDELVSAIAHSPPREPAAWTPPVETPLDLHLGSCDTLTDRAFPCNCAALREQHSSASGPPTSENCKLLGAEVCTHDKLTQVEPGDVTHPFVTGKFQRGERGGQMPEETCEVCGRDPRNAVHVVSHQRTASSGGTYMLEPFGEPITAIGTTSIMDADPATKARVLDQMEHECRRITIESTGTVQQPRDEYCSPIGGDGCPLHPRGCPR